MRLHRWVLPVLLLAPEGLRADPGTPDPWQVLSAPFRRQAVSVPPGHAVVAPAVASRRALRSPFLVPVSVLQKPGRDGKAQKPVDRDGAKAMLKDMASRLEAIEAMLQGGAVDKVSKELDALSQRISGSLFPDRELRLQAEGLSGRIDGLKRRVAVRLAFAKLNPQVTFIICASEASGASLAVVNQRIVRPGDTLPGGFRISRITPREVVFALEDEEIAVGLK